LAGDGRLPESGLGEEDVIALHVAVLVLEEPVHGEEHAHNRNQLVVAGGVGHGVEMAYSGQRHGDVAEQELLVVEPVVMILMLILIVAAVVVVLMVVVGVV
jgi:hypothetical protein